MTLLPFLLPATTTMSPATTVTQLEVISPQGYEAACKLPIAISTAVLMIVMLPINVIGMFTLFTKIEKMFNPNRIQASQRQESFTNRLTKKRYHQF